MTKKISILGSTGSIGLSTLDIIRRHPDRFQVTALSAGLNLDLLAGQVREFRPAIVSVKTGKAAVELEKIIGANNVEIFHGPEGAEKVAVADSADMVISAIVGAAGLLPTLSALKRGKTVGLANKESMVIAGLLMRKAMLENGGRILPIDSEHSAIFQCLEGHRPEDVRRLILTASGGPFLDKPAGDFSSITRAEALSHPRWNMGAKVTIDSATMMNKGLEIMEASLLFDVPIERIGVYVHPQSIVHSMVEYIDGSTLAQMGMPDMKTPIAYALSYPQRIETGVAPLDLPKTRKLDFFEPDFEKFPCLKTAVETAKKGRSYPAVLNAANEMAVEAFLREEISFLEIHPCVEKTVLAHDPVDLKSLEDVMEADRWAREFSSRLIRTHFKTPCSI